MGICIEPPENVLGLHGFEHWVHRTAEERARARGQQVGGGHTPRSRAQRVEDGQHRGVGERLIVWWYQFAQRP